MMGARRGRGTMTTAGVARSLVPTLTMVAAIVAIAVPIGSPPPAAAAGFPCDKVVEPDEVAVCGTPELSALDVQMVTLYDVVLKLVGMGVRADLQDQQRAFLKARATCGGDVTCIAALYDQRIASLHKVIDDIAARGPY